ncbi:MAG: extracellular solute-binding protein [Firmicutes bacterium]|nr:extracellular solute-binding protein [Bacillota bacterium]
MKKILSVLLIISLVLGLTVGCSSKANEKPGDSIILATTTSTRDSGLLDEIIPKFKEKTGVKVKVIAVGTGKALQMGRDGEADVLLVHAKEAEEKFVSEGHGLKREDVMYNDFVLVGPKDDKGQLQKKAPNDIIKGYKLIKENKLKFVSRGDDSGTHKKEKSLWEDIKVKPEGKWYISAGSGMADVLKLASEKQAYTMTDRATYLNLKDKLDLEIIIEKDDRLFNQYGVIPVNPDKNENINNKGAKTFIKWLLSEETQNLIKDYGKDKFNMPLFQPNANK